MSDSPIDAPFILFPDRLLFLKPKPGERHRFGGTRSANFKKWISNAPLPQLVFTIDLNDPKLGLDPQDLKIPLYFPFQLNGASLTYTFDSQENVLQWQSDGTPLEDWPYQNYPASFPEKSFEIFKTESVDWNKLEDDEDWTGITLQDSRPNDGELLFVIPSCKSIGDILWGADGFSAGVQTCFRVHIQKRQVAAFTEMD